MWWCDFGAARRRLVPLAFVLAAASLTAGCFEPLYGNRPSMEMSSVRDKFAQIEIPVIPAPKGQSASRIAVALRNALQYDLNGAAGPTAPTYRLVVYVGVSGLTVTVDVTSGRAEDQVSSVNANYQLIEIATGKVVVNDNTFAHVDYDIPGTAQRFASQRAQRHAEDRATGVVAEAIRNRLASYFVAGT